jgi:histidine phosphotransfer protein HptB
MNPSPIDRDTFSALQDAAGADFVVELVDTFLEEGPQMLAELRSALAAADADRFRRAAHSLKSNAHTFGALALGAQARELELGGIAAATPPALQALEAGYAQCAAALKDRRDA